MRTVYLTLSVLLLAFFIYGCGGGTFPLTPPGDNGEPQEPSQDGDNGLAQSYLGGGHPIEGVTHR